jgi:hypothetical protein
LAKDAANRLSSGDAGGAASLYKAHLVQYLEWVYAHTLPFAQADIPVTHQIVEVDIETITELSDTIAHCLSALGREEEIPAFFERHPMSEFSYTSASAHRFLTVEWFEQTDWQPWDSRLRLRSRPLHQVQTRDPESKFLLLPTTLEPVTWLSAARR